MSLLFASWGCLERRESKNGFALIDPEIGAIVSFSSGPADPQFVLISSHQQKEKQQPSGGGGDSSVI